MPTCANTLRENASGDFITPTRRWKMDSVINILPLHMSNKIGGAPVLIFDSKIV